MLEPMLNSSQVECFDCLTVSFSLPKSYDNPFDPREIQVDGHFVSSGGSEKIMPGFFYQECQRKLSDDGVEIVEKIGEPYWMVRFAPTIPGKWQVQVKARDLEGEISSLPQFFTAMPSNSTGFIRRASGTNYFCYEDGTSFFPVGENMAWCSQRGTFDFDEWLPAAHAGGMNLVRIWLQWLNHLFSIETPTCQVGHYDLANTWKMDQVLKKARECKLRVLFTMDTPEPYTPENFWLGKVYNRSWQTCPYNAANGGPLSSPGELFTHPEGSRLIRQRLRYIVARWGWDNNIFCWQLWNELNLFPDWEPIATQIGEWHNEMAVYLKEIDPNRHLVSTSFYNVEGIPEVWQAQEMDFVEPHVYGAVDMADTLPEVTRFVMRQYGWPVLIDEFGPPLASEFLNLSNLDPTGIHLHNAIWSTSLAGGAGAALTWWWDSYIHPLKLYSVFTPLMKFIQDVSWHTASFRPLTSNVGWVSPSGADPPVRCIGLVGKSMTLVWIQNIAHTFETVSAKKTAPSIEGVRVVLKDLPAGSCRVEWWDTERGEVLHRDDMIATPNGLSLDLPLLSSDFALKIRYV